MRNLGPSCSSRHTRPRQPSAGSSQLPVGSDVTNALRFVIREIFWLRLVRGQSPGGQTPSPGSWIGSVVLALGASGFLIAAAVAEERENLQRFGPDYAAYLKRTRRFVPVLW